MTAVSPAGAPRMLLRSDAYEVVLDGDTLQVTFLPPFDPAAASTLRALFDLARDLGMDVRAQVRPRGAPDST